MRLSDISSKNKAKVFGMFSTGNVQKVQLRGINQMAEQVIDAFGSQRLIFAPDGDKYFKVVVDVDVSPTFFAWVCTYGSKLKIESPQSVVEEMKEFVSKLSEMYST